MTLPSDAVEPDAPAAPSAPPAEAEEEIKFIPEDQEDVPPKDDDNPPPSGGSVQQLDPRVSEILEGVNEFYIQQRIRWGEALTQGCFEQKNIYDVFDKATMKKIFVIREESSDASRCCCKPGHSLFARFFLVDADTNEEVGSPVMTMEREGCDCVGGPCPKPWIGCWACKPECTDGATLYSGDFGEDAIPGSEMGALRDGGSRLLGAAVQPINGGKFKPVVQIMERGGDGDEPSTTMFAATRGPCFFGGCSELCCDSEFGISKAKDGMGVDEIHQLAFDHASITKVRPKSFEAAMREAVTDSDTYIVEFKEEGVTVQQKANVLSSIILLDYMFFERDNDMCRRNYDSTTITCFNCFCYGCICPCEVTIPDPDFSGND